MVAWSDQVGLAGAAAAAAAARQHNQNDGGELRAAAGLSSSSARQTSRNHCSNRGRSKSPSRASRLAASSKQKDWKEEHPYCEHFSPIDPNVGDDLGPRIYSASCYCGRVRYDVRGDPITSKMCHCGGCQLLHGAPFEWVAIFDKQNVRFNPHSLPYLYFYNSTLDKGWDSQHASKREQPVKVSCSHCRSPVADEGKRNWLAFPTLFGFTKEATDIPRSFRYSCHLFYKQRCIDINGDGKTKWDGLENSSSIWQPDWDE